MKLFNRYLWFNTFIVCNRNILIIVYIRLRVVNASVARWNCQTKFQLLYLSLFKFYVNCIEALNNAALFFSVELEQALIIRARVEMSATASTLK